MESMTTDKRITRLERAILVIGAAAVLAIALPWWSSHRTGDLRAHSVVLFDDAGRQIARLGSGRFGPILVLESGNRSVLVGALGPAEFGVSVAESTTPMLALSAGDAGALLTLSVPNRSAGVSLGVDIEQRPLLLLRGTVADLGLLPGPEAFLRVKDKEGRVLYQIEQPERTSSKR
jgi:hypothetical protein